MEWTAEVRVDEALARRLIGGQFPGLRLLSLEAFAEGWDNSVWLVNGSLLFRFPRRAIAIPGVQREMEVLPDLAPLLPLPVPRPELLGKPTGGYPWPFFGAPLIAGREASDVDLDGPARAALARPLALFLRRLHSPEVAGAITGAHELPADPMGRADMARRVPRARSALEEVERLRLWAAPASIWALLDAAEPLPAPEPECVVHGDLHFRHLLIGDDGGLTGVVDWGDLCFGCRSIDLQLLWSFLPPEARPCFLDAYGPVAGDDLLRARVLAFFLSAMLAAYGHEAGMSNVEREAVGSLERAESD